MSATLKSRLPLIAAELRPRVSAAVRAGAGLMSERAKVRAPDAPPLGEGLVSAIHVERQGPAEYAVVAGDDDVFWGHFVEFGTVHSAPKPFLVPAFEESVNETVGLVQGALRRL